MEKPQLDTLFEKLVTELEASVYTALQTYSNVHRGTGHNSMVTTVLYERAREVILDLLELTKDCYEVIFCTPRKIDAYKRLFPPQSLHIVSSEQLGLPVGIGAVVIERQKLPKSAISETGGGTVRMVYPSAVVWADAPNRFEAGTPSIINAIALAKALQLITRHGKNVFENPSTQGITISEILYQDELTEHTGRRLLADLQKTFVGQKVCVPTIGGAAPYVNLDNGASTPTFEPIWETVRLILRQPKSDYPPITQEVRKICAEFLGAPMDEYEVVFTSNTTEAINIVAQNLAHESDKTTTPVVVTTLLEHNSNELPWRYLSGATVIQIPVDEEGFLNLHELEALFIEYNQQKKHGTKRIRIMALCGASNVLGTINDLQAISRIVHRYNAHLVVDGAQLVAHRQIALTDIGIDYFAFSGHKVYAPFGSGALIVKRDLLNFEASEFETIKSSGEKNVVGIAAMGKALLLLQRIGLDVIEHYERALTQQALDGLNKIAGVRVYGIRSSKSSRFKDRLGIITLSSMTVPHNLVAKELAELGGIGVRNGCFCAHMLVSRLMNISSIRVAASKVLFNFIPELTSTVLPGLIRVSLSLENTDKDVTHFLRVLEKIIQNPRFVTNRLLASAHYATPFVPHTKIEEQMKAFTARLVQQVYSSTRLDAPDTR
jgi:selenocysteine lyase/cysteine desulfurase